MLPEEFKDFLKEMFEKSGNLFAEVIDKYILQSQRSVEEKIEALSTVIEESPFLPIGACQKCINFVLKNSKVEELGRIEEILRIVDDMEYARENLELILKSSSRERLKYALILGDSEPLLLLDLSTNMPEKVKEVIRACISSPEKHPNLARASIPILCEIESSYAPLERFLKIGKKRRGTEHLLRGMLDIAEKLPEELQRKVLDKVIELGDARLRKQAYRLGETLIGEEYRERALKDKAKSIREWAARERIAPGRVKRRRELTLEECLNRAQDRLNENKPELALKYAEKALAMGGGDEALFLKAEALFALGEDARAEAIIDELVVKGYIPAYSLLGMQRISKADLDGALKAVEEGLRIEPESYDLKITKAQILYFLGREEYEEILEELMQEDEIRTELFLSLHWMDEPPNPVFIYWIKKAGKAAREGDLNTLREVEGWLGRFEYPEAAMIIKAIAQFISGDVEGAKETLKQAEELVEEEEIKELIRHAIEIFEGKAPKSIDDLLRRIGDELDLLF